MTSNSDGPVPESRPTLLQLETAALRLLSDRVLSKGGMMPSEAALRAVCRTLASRGLREFDSKHPDLAPKDQQTESGGTSGGTNAVEKT